MNATVVTNLAPRRAIVDERENRKAVIYGRSAPGPVGSTGSIVQALTMRGTQVVGVGIVPLSLPFDARLLAITATVGVAPTGQALIFDVLKNGNSILGNVVLSIQPGETVALPIIPDDDILLTTDKLTVNVVQVGSLQPGAYATISIEATKL
jgi:hypothetical protein